MMTETEKIGKPKPKPKPLAPVVLELRGVTFRDESAVSIQLRRANLILRQGELVMLHLGWSQKARNLASMLQGLHKPLEGEVLFQKQDWLGEDYDRHFEMRSRIGRVFEDQAWIENINVAANVTLASRHHGATVEAIEADVAYWANHFGIDSLSQERPAFVDPSLLQVHQWIRAFIGKPTLLLLERPLKSVAMSQMPRLVDAVNKIRQRGSAVIWFTSNVDDASNSLAGPVFHYEIRAGQFTPIERSIKS